MHLSYQYSFTIISHNNKIKMLCIEFLAEPDSVKCLKRETEKLIALSTLFNDLNHDSFWLGYLVSFVKISNEEKIDQQKIEVLKKCITFLGSMVSEKLISRELSVQVIATMLYVQQRAGNLQKAGLNIEKADNYIRDCITELVINPAYLKSSFYSEQKIINNRKKSQENDRLGLQCSICCEQITLSQVCPIACGHNLHKNCFIKHFQSQLEDKKFPIKCTEEECGEQISIRDIEQYIPKEVLDKFYEFSLHQLVDKNSVIHWCPTPGCKGIFELQQALSVCKCPVCEKEYCLSCRTEAHHDKTCEENKALLNLPEEEKKFREFAKDSKYKQCPSCKFWVEKNKGCDHITCRCSYEFCFRCGAEYGNGECNCDENDSFYGDGEDDPDMEDVEDEIYE